MAPEQRGNGGSFDFIKALGLWDLVLMNVVAVVGLRWIPRAARIGPASVLFWVLACLTFFVPLALAVSELSSRHPEQGGIYPWARRAFGPLHGFVCGWCLWMNNLFYFPSLLLFGAANAALLLGPTAARLANERFYSVGFVLIGLWALVWLNIVGLRAGRWLQNAGSIGGTWVPAALLIGLGAVAAARYGSATKWVGGDLLPSQDVWGSVSLWSSMCFAFSGFEITSMIGQEIREPRRNIPRAVMISGLMATAIYLIGSVAVLVSIPSSDLVERSGMADTVELVGSRIGIGGLGAIMGGLLALSALAGTSSWIAGAARVPFAAGVDHALPSWFGHLHGRYRTPDVSLIVQGLAASAIFLASVFISVSHQQTTIQEAYDILVNLTILIYFVPYLYLFPALVRLRPAGSPAVDERRVPGGNAGMYIVAAIGFLATAISLALVFIPPPGTRNAMNYEVNLIGQALVILGVGLAMYWYARGAGRKLLGEN